MCVPGDLGLPDGVGLACEMALPGELGLPGDEVTWWVGVTWQRAVTWWGSRAPWAQSGGCSPPQWGSSAPQETGCSLPGSPDGYRPGARTPGGAEEVNEIHRWAVQGSPPWQPPVPYQCPHVVDAARDVNDVVVAEVEFPQSGQIGERRWQSGQVVIGQTQHLTETERIHLSHFTDASFRLYVQETHVVTAARRRDTAETCWQLNRVDHERKSQVLYFQCSSQHSLGL